MARKSRKQTASPMPAPSLYVHVALYIRLSVEDNKKRGCSVENPKLVLNDFLSDKPDFGTLLCMIPISITERQGQIFTALDFSKCYLILKQATLTV